jgi:large subunit ribosomal protein L1
MDRSGNIGALCGKASFDADKLVGNITTLLDAVKAERPASTKGAFIRSMTISSTMGVGVRVLVKE